MISDRLFTIITLDELHELITQGTEHINSQGGKEGGISS